MSDRPNVQVNAIGCFGLLLVLLFVFSCVGVKVRVEHETPWPDQRSGK